MPTDVSRILMTLMGRRLAASERNASRASTLRWRLRAMPGIMTYFMASFW